MALRSPALTASNSWVSSFMGLTLNNLSESHLLNPGFRHNLHVNSCGTSGRSLASVGRGTGPAGGRSRAVAEVPDRTLSGREGAVAQNVGKRGERQGTGSARYAAQDSPD